MKQVVIMPGGFHPFHAGHYALYQQAQDAFPGADVYVAATNDTSTRPFPFAVKEKLAKLAGVEPGHFVQVKSPFQAREITANLDPENTQLIFVRSEKDADKPPQAGGVKKDGTPAYLQLLKGQTELAPMNQHAYMAYLPTVEFGPGMTSATEIRTAWPQLNEKRKTALVMSLYPRTQKNPKLADTVVKMLDLAILGQEINENANPRIDLTPNFPNYSKLVGEFTGARNNKLLFQIVAAELNPGARPTEKIVKAMSANRPIAMAPNYVKNRQVVPENDDDEYAAPGLSDEQLRQLHAKMKQMKGRQPFVWLKPNQISGSHTDQELLSIGFKKSEFNNWGGTQQMWNRLAGIDESADYIQEKISR